MRKLLGLLSGLVSSNAVLLKHLQAQISSGREGAAVARQVVLGEVPTSRAREEMGAIEHDGDRHRRRLIEALNRSLMPPLDREDLFRLSRSIDDVLDNLRDFVRESDLMGVEDDDVLADMLLEIDHGLHELGDAIGHALDGRGLVPARALMAKKRSSQIHQQFQVAIARLLEEGVGTEVLRKRELLGSLDQVGLRLGEAADALADGAMKRSH